jgi:hypothetical protein
MGEAFEWRGKNCPITKHAEADPIVSELTSHRWRGPILSRDEERELVRLAQAPNHDGDAKRRLMEKFSRQVLRIAGKYHGPPFEERVATGYVGLLKAIHDFDLGRNLRLATAVGTYVAREIWTSVRSFSRRWPPHISLSSVKSESPERSDRDGERWETWEPRRVGYRRPYCRVNWWWRPPAWAKNQLGVGRSAVRIVPMRALEPVQRLLKQIDRLYRRGCDFPWRGDCKRWSDTPVGLKFKDMPNPTMLAVRSHLEVTRNFLAEPRKSYGMCLKHDCFICTREGRLAALERNITDKRIANGRIADASDGDSIYRAIHRAIRRAA